MFAGEGRNRRYPAECNWWMFAGDDGNRRYPAECNWWMFAGEGGIRSYPAESVTDGCLLERVEIESECMHCNDGRMHVCIPQ